jgi:molybdopterin converting factor subunit 1
MKTKILLFAHLKDKAGTREAELDLPARASAADLKARLAEVYPALKPALANAIVAINREFMPDEALIPEGAEIAIFPPVSGG